jgi:hypothetical protein
MRFPARPDPAADGVDFRKLCLTARSLGRREVRRNAWDLESVETALQELKAQEVVARAAAIGVRDALRDAIRLGATWQDVGDALGVTRQLAHSRFAAMVGEPPDPEEY